jgi:tripartite ATP-independent transporter DctM subunit
MDWWLVVLLLLAGMFILMLLKYPVAFVFLTINLVVFFLLLGGSAGIRTMVLSLFNSLFSFTFIAIPMFLLMGEILFRSGMAVRSINSLDMLMGKIPGRLSILTALAGVIFAATSGSVMANTAMLGSIMTPEMEKRGYHRSMIFGPIMGVGGLAMLIPPSALAVLYASIAEISVGAVLIGGIIPGILLGALYIAQIIIRVQRNPSLAPAYEVKSLPAGVKLLSFIKDVLPLGILIFAVIGTILLGLATPSESAALGALGAILLCFYNRSFSFKLLWACAFNTFKICGMTFAIIAASVGFGQILAYTGAVKQISALVTVLPLAPIVIVILTQLIVVVFGCFMDVVPIMMITIPIFFPIVYALELDPLWFAIINLVNLQMANITPPFGMNLFIMKGVAGPDTKMAEIYRSVMPFLLCNLIGIAIILVFPQTTTWLPSLIRSV